MKILRVIASMDPGSGGPCQGIRNIIPELSKWGVQNEVVCINSPSEDFVRKDPFPVHALGKSNNRWGYQPDLIPWLTDNLMRFDIIIIHGLWLYTGFAVHKTIRRFIKEGRNRIPQVYVMPHGMLDPYFQKTKKRRLKAVRNWMYWKLIEGPIINKADGVLFTCREELELAGKSFHPYRPRKELNIGYGIQPPPSFITHHKRAFAAKLPALNQPYFLFLSRIHEKKGVDILIKAYLLYKKKNPLLPALVIAGPGMESFFAARLKRMVLESGNRNIYFTGMLTGDAKWGALYGCTAFVLPSHQENFGIAVVEAMACGKPVLISNKVNIWKEIEQGGAGIIEEDTSEGAYRLFETWDNKLQKEKDRMGHAAKKTFDDHFTIKKSAVNFLKIVCPGYNFQSTAVFADV